MRTLVLIPSALEYLGLFRESAPLFGQRCGIPFAHTDAIDIALCGIGPAAAAFCTGSLLAQGGVGRVILLGIAGAFRASGLEIGDVVQAKTELFADLGHRDGGVFRTLDDIHLPLAKIHDIEMTCRYPVELLDEQLPSGDFISVSSVTADHETADQLYLQFAPVAENMEGAAVAMACAAYARPFHEVRAISNFVGPRDPSQWQIHRALANLSDWLHGFLEENQD